MGNTTASLTADKSTTLFPKLKGQSLSYWLQGVRANPLLDHRTTENLPESADVVIIGSGMTGALTALTLLSSPNPPSSILMLEARELCSGATGRNAGHCKPDQWRGYTKHKGRVGKEQALKILANEQETFEKLVEYVRANTVDCDLWVGKTMDVAMTEEVAAQCAENFNQLREDGGKIDGVEWIQDREEARKRSRIPNAISAFSWDAASFYPWKVVAHMIERCLSFGNDRFNLQTWTTVKSVEPADDDLQMNSEDGRKWVVETDRGSTATDTVVFATNAYTAGLLSEFEGVIVPTPHLCDKVIPPPSFSGSHSLQNTYGILLPNDALFSINSRSSSDGIVLFGGSNPGISQFLKWVDEHPDERTNDGLSGIGSVTNAVKEFIDTGSGWSTQGI
ncbi:hypothetical protein VKT23_014707 [Stygiomarasmius scandens]|uniref:FAD dependent oxidoreductase domain-containing protein n=1 Tax=Marasmiellus scandens TaxID=2682957 RepID=A0ABR1J467_9AGAR